MACLLLGALIGMLAYLAWAVPAYAHQERARRGREAYWRSMDRLMRKAREREARRAEV